MREILAERPNLFEPNDYITFRIKISGTANAGELVSAVKEAYKANESTMSRIILRDDGAAFYEKLSHSGCKVEILQKDWREIIRENEKLPFDLKNGELVRSFIVPGENGIVLLIMAHHLAGDGKAVVYFTQSVMNALSGDEFQYKPMLPLAEETRKLPLFIRLYTAALNRKWQKNGGRVFTWEDYYRIHSRYWEKSASCIHSQTLSTEQTALLREKAHKAGVSVNSLLVAAFLQADIENRVTGVPVSVRGKSDKSMTNKTSAISINHRYSGRRSFTQNAKLVHRKVRRAVKKNRMFVLRFVKELSPAIIDGVLLSTHGCLHNQLAEKLARVMGYMGKSKRDLGVTNLTVIDIPAVYGGNRIEDMIFIPPVVSYSNNIIGVSTAWGKMTVTFHAMEDGRKQDEFFEKCISCLLNL